MSRLDAWRSLLFVPANDARRLARADARGADGLILDLEDGIELAAKQAARAGLGEVIGRLADKKVDLLVRINAGWGDAWADLSAAALSPVVAVVVPKAEDPARLEVISQMLAELETERGLACGSIALVALIESSGGLARAAALAAVPRVSALAFGTEDFSVSLGVPPTRESLDLPCRLLALAAATRGLQCLAMPFSIAQFADAPAFNAAAEYAVALGCTGALCVHPSQVSIANERFVATPEALQHARRVVASWTHAQTEGYAVSQLNGVMIDKPVADRALRLLQRRCAE